MSWVSLPVRRPVATMMFFSAVVILGIVAPVFLLGSAGWTERRQTLLEAALQDWPRPVWVGNPDVVAPRQEGFTIEPGYYAHRLADRTGIVPRFFGKPFGNIFDTALARLDGAVDPASLNE